MLGGGQGYSLLEPVITTLGFKGHCSCIHLGGRCILRALGAGDQERAVIAQLLCNTCLEVGKAEQTGAVREQRVERYSDTA